MEYPLAAVLWLWNMDFSMFVLKNRHRYSDDKFVWDLPYIPNRHPETVDLENTLKMWAKCLSDLKLWLLIVRAPIQTIYWMVIIWVYPWSFLLILKFRGSSWVDCEWCWGCWGLFWRYCYFFADLHPFSMINIEYNNRLIHHSFKRTRSLNYFSSVFNRCPLRFFISHLPISVLLLFLMSSSRFFSSYVANISPATFLHWGWAISSFMVSTLTYSFSNSSLTLNNSCANFCYSILIYSLMLLSDSLNASSTKCKIWSLSAFN